MIGIRKHNKTNKKPNNVHGLLKVLYITKLCVRQSVIRMIPTELESHETYHNSTAMLGDKNFHVNSSFTGDGTVNPSHPIQQRRGLHQSECSMKSN